MATKVKGPEKTKIPTVEYSNGKAIDGSKDRAVSIGKDSMTGKDYFYRGGVKKP